MSFSTLFKNPTTRKPSSGFGSLFANLPQDQLERKQRIARYQHEARQFQNEAKRATSFNAIKDDAFGRLAKIPQDFLSGLFKTYEETPGKLARSVQTGAEDFNRGKALAPTVAGFRVAGDTAIAIYAPVSAAIGAVLNATGGTEGVEKLGQSISDSIDRLTGLTDQPWYQRFAMENPEAHADFDRLTVLLLSGLEKGDINPKRMYAETKAFADKHLPKTPEVSATKMEVFKPSKPVLNAKEIIDEHITSAKQVAENLPPERIKADGGVKGLIENAQKNASMALDSYGFTTEAAGIRNLKTATMTSLDDFARAAEAVTKDSTGVIVPPRARPAEIRAEPGEAVNTRADKLLRVAEERGIVPKGEPVPTHTVVRQVESRQAARDLVETNLEEALRQFRETPVENVSQRGFLYTALEERAIRTRDAALVRELAESKAPTVAGQELKAFDSSDPFSPVRILRDVQNAFVAAIEKKGVKIGERKKAEVKVIEGELKNNASKRPTWEQFINELTCGY